MPLLRPEGFRALLTSGLTGKFCETKIHLQTEKLFCLLRLFAVEENLVVQKFVKRFNAPYARDFNGEVGSRVSHVIVHEDDDCGPPRTMKFLMGISRNNYVVTIGWVSKCLKKGGLIDEVNIISMFRTAILRLILYYFRINKVSSLIGSVCGRFRRFWSEESPRSESEASRRDNSPREVTWTYDEKRRSGGRP